MCVLSRVNTVRVISVSCSWSQLCAVRHCVNAHEDGEGEREEQPGDLVDHTDTVHSGLTLGLQHHSAVPLVALDTAQELLDARVS